MRKIVPYIAILWLLIAGCQDPTTVDASRQLKPKEIPQSGNDLIAIMPDSLDFGFVKPNQTRSNLITISNLKEDTLNIFKVEFKGKQNYFTLNSAMAPKTLSKAGDSGYYDTLSVRFQQSEPGIYTDTLKVNDYKKPVLRVNAVIPYVYADDYNIDSVKPGSFSIENMKIYNISHQDFTISEFNFDNTGDNSVFSLINNVGPGSIIPADSSLLLIITYAPTESKEYKMKVTFHLNTSLPYKNDFIIDGLSIKK